MIDYLFNRTIFLWATAMVIALLIVDPHDALLQRVNTMNETTIVDCLKEEYCTDRRTITEAREYYTILAELYPNYGRGLEMEGICHLLLKQDRLAIKNFQDALKHNPDLFWVSFELGKAYYRQGEYTKALQCFQTILTEDNNTLLKKAALSTLRAFPNEIREELFLQLVDFITEIKFQSYQMAAGCLAHQNNPLAYTKPIFHPWGHLIPPLKEMYYP